VKCDIIQNFQLSHYGVFLIKKNRGIIMDYVIRPIRLEDAEAINEVRRMDGVMETILGIKSERINKTEDFIKGLGANDHIFVAEVNNVEKKVVGVVGLHI